MNASSVPPVKIERLLGRFNPALRSRFRNFTGEELFYAYRLIGENPKRDHFRHSLRWSLIEFLRQGLSNQNPLSIEQWFALSLQDRFVRA